MMTVRSSRLAMAFSKVGYFFAHFLMLLDPTVVLAHEGRWGLTDGERRMIRGSSWGAWITAGLRDRQLIRIRCIECAPRTRVRVTIAK
jgi:hypothetical protein